MEQFRIVQNQLGEYGVEILFKENLFPWEYQGCLLRQKKIWDDHYYYWFKWKWTAESLKKATEKAIAKRLQEEQNIINTKLRRNTFKPI